MHYFADYGIFLAKFLTVAFIIVVTLAAILMLLTKVKEQQGAMRLKIKKLNAHYDEVKEMIQSAVLNKHQLKKAHKNDKKRHKAEEKAEDHKANLFVINFEGDIRASAVQSMSELITAILLTAQPDDEVLLRLESGGGLVNAYGLASSQLQRLRDAKIKLTIAIDKMAASGGYMMACVADKIIAAPFAIIGSIGVIAQLPNFHRFLEKHHIDFEQVTAGEYKRTLTLFGENTRKARQKLQEEIDDTQGLFKAFIGTHRPQVDLDKVATGEHWFAKQALELALVDELKTSDDYLLMSKDHKAIYELHYVVKKPWVKRLGLAAESLISKCLSGKWQQAGKDYL